MAATQSFSAKEDLTLLLQLVADIARREIMSRFKRISLAEVKSKTSGFDIVTEADEMSEAALLAELGRLFPGALLVGEEAAFKNPTLIEKIDDAELAFIIDPLDGTRNFASGLPLFGVMVAVTIKGKIIAGVIHDPVRNDSAYAYSEKGAWLMDDSGTSVKLAVAADTSVSKMEAIIGTNFLPEPMRTKVNMRMSRLGISNWFRCAAHEYRLAAAGHVHMLFYNKLMPWDHAAGWLLHKEAGGHSGHFDGSEYRASHTAGGLICAPSRESWNQIHRQLIADV